MSVLTARLGSRGPSRPQRFRPTLPTVDLLSEAARERLLVRRMWGRFAVAGVVLLVVIGGLWGAQSIRVGEEQKRLTAEQAQTARLLDQTRALAPLRAFSAGVAARKALVDSTVAHQVRVAQVVSGLQDATPLGSSITSIALTLVNNGTTTTGDPAVSTAATTCPGPDPFATRPVIGCITLAGTAGSRAEVGELVQSLGSNPLFVEPFISTTTTGDSAQVTFSGSVGVSPMAYRLRAARAADGRQQP